MAKVDLKDMSIRNEFADEVINSIEELQSKAITNGEMKILYLIFLSYFQHQVMPLAHPTIK